MENASKALIIAGAILISIVLIGIGVTVVNSINEPLDQATDSATAQAIEMFNTNFTQYEGNNVRGSKIKQLASKVNAVNGTNEERQVTLTYTGTLTASSVNSQKTYTVEFGYDSGYINEITVTEN